MSELDVIVIHIRAEQAAEYERLFAERELPRWREYKERGAFISARIFRAAFGTDRRQDIAKYVIAAEVPSHAEHSQHDADPGFQEFNRLADAFQPEIRWRTADRCCTLSDRHSASASARGGAAMQTTRNPAGSSTPSRVPDDDPERLLMKRAGLCDTRPEFQPTGAAAVGARAASRSG